jgi:hypothetical protein
VNPEYAPYAFFAFIKPQNVTVGNSRPRVWVYLHTSVKRALSLSKSLVLNDALISSNSLVVGGIHSAPAVEEARKSETAKIIKSIPLFQIV